ncbi:MAG: hypothetical protein IPN97_00780 [Saprospiraceae bacterium]|nr:hypothetical protein [Saprospiraceae bacterium]MBK8853665.1 hypothetical protein [Saprospiraceae bacterium]MBK9041757.1 hypothetical protein [Saprospiraceae bacterium]
MTFKQLINLEDAAKEVWVISPGLHYDVENKDFSELVSVNLGQKTKYRYIVPANKAVLKNLEVYKKKYAIKDREIMDNFLILPENEFIPFVLEIAIYDANTNCIACAAPALEGENEVIRFTNDAAQQMAKDFREIWKKFKREKF